MIIVNIAKAIIYNKAMFKFILMILILKSNS